MVAVQIRPRCVGTVHVYKFHKELIRMLLIISLKSPNRFTDQAVEDLTVSGVILNDDASQVLRRHHNHCEHFVLWNVTNVCRRLGHRYYFSQALIKTTTLANGSPRSCALGRKAHDGLHPDRATFPSSDVFVIMPSKGPRLFGQPTVRVLIGHTEFVDTLNP